MYFCDSHTHSSRSFDGHDSVFRMAEAALAAGMHEIVITDHYDVNGEVENLYPHLDVAALAADVADAKDAFRGKLEITFGIELGQPNQYPEDAAKLLCAYPFEFVIGSVHNVTAAPDFYYMNYEKMPTPVLDALFSRTLEELRTVAGMGMVTTLGHITYMERYMELCGKRLDYGVHRDGLYALFETMIRNDVALELNVSSLSRGRTFLMPERELLDMYRDAGGKLVTCGTDAHLAERVGVGIREGYEVLLAHGFDRIVSCAGGRRTLQKIGG